MFYFVLKFLPLEYEHVQINYNIIRDKWNINELTSGLAQKEARLKSQKSHIVDLVWKKVDKGIKPNAKSFKNKR